MSGRRLPLLLTVWDGYLPTLAPLAPKPHPMEIHTSIRSPISERGWRKAPQILVGAYLSLGDSRRESVCQGAHSGFVLTGRDRDECEFLPVRSVASERAGEHPIYPNSLRSGVLLSRSTAQKWAASLRKRGPPPCRPCTVCLATAKPLLRSVPKLCLDVKPLARATHPAGQPFSWISPAPP